jgi:SAM-dependent methyltransferase
MVRAEVRPGTGEEGMADSFSGKLQIWDGWRPALLKGPAPPLSNERLLLGLNQRPDLAQGLYEGETLHTEASCEGAEPFTLQWFLEIEHARHGKHGSWIPRVLEFTKHAGETLLGIGTGLGTDWVQYARHGAEVVACCPSAEHLAMVQHNFELRGLRGVFVQASPVALPLEPASIDVVCATGLLQDVMQPAALVAEIYRVLKPGGKVLAVTPARYDIDFWCRCCLPWHLWLRRRKPLPATPAFSGRGLRHLFARFVEPRVYKRHLRRRDIPHLWRWIPRPLMDRLMGRLLVFKGFKPLSAAITVQAAA